MKYENLLFQSKLEYQDFKLLTPFINKKDYCTRGFDPVSSQVVVKDNESNRTTKKK